MLLALVAGGLCLSVVAALAWAGWLKPVAIFVAVVLCAISFGIHINEFFSRKR